MKGRVFIVFYSPKSKKITKHRKGIPQKNELKKANAYYEKVLPLYQKNKLHKEYLTVKSYMVSSLRVLREYELSASLAREVIAESRTHFGAENNIEATAYSTLAVIVSTNNQHDKAIKIYNRIIKIWFFDNFCINKKKSPSKLDI